MNSVSQIMYDVEQSSRRGADSIQSNQLEEAIYSFLLAYERSKQLDDGQTERACAFNLGAAYIAAQQPLKGLEYLEKATPPGNKKDGRSNGDLYFNFGLAYESMNHTEEAVRSFSTALEEYKLENDSVTFPKEAETLEKLCKLYVKSNNIFSADAYEKLSYTYQSMKEPAKQLNALCKRASVLQKCDRTATEIIEAATKCEELLTSEVCRESSFAGNVYNELGLIYTELQMFNDAQRCFDAALPLVRSSNQPNKKQEAIILQNLGASCNFVGNYQRALQFHMDAAKCYAQLKNRNSQGQCYANLAFAFSQLGRLDLAKENFNHALLAAKDTDDKRSQWQVLEGLGAVAYNEKNIDEAIKFYKEALKAASSGKNVSAVQERLVEKLQSCLKVQISGKTYMTRPAIRSTPSAVTPGVPPSEKMIKKETATYTTAAKRDQSKRFVPVNRPGTSRQYNKVARGLSTLSGGTLASLPDAGETLRPGTILDTDDTAGSSEEFSSSDDSETEFKKRVMSSAPMKLTSERSSVNVTHHPEPIQSSDDSSSSSSDLEEDDDEEKDKEAVKKEMQQFQSQSSSADSSEDSDTDTDDSQTRVKQKLISESESPETKQSLPVTKTKSPMEPISDEDSSSEEDDEEDDDESEYRSPMEPASDESSSTEEEDDEVPDLPTSSPVPTTSMAMNTYETAKDSNKNSRELPRQTSYKDIDFETTQKQGEEKFHQENSQHPNFLSDELVESDIIQQLFHDGEDIAKYEKFTPPLRSHGENEQSDADDPKEFDVSDEEETKLKSADTDQEDEPEDDFDEDMNDPVYQSIKPRDMADLPSFDKTERASSFADLPRGEQEDKPNSRRSSSSSVNSKGERYLHEKHQEIIQKRQENQTEEQVEKKSNVCIVM